MGTLPIVPIAVSRGCPYMCGDATARKPKKNLFQTRKGDCVRIAILCGTGEQGPGLALRWALAGEEVIISSRSRERAEKVAIELNAKLGQPLIRGMENPQAAEVVVLTIPYTAHLSTLESVKAQVRGWIPTIRAA
jgi:hypothetical protein